MINHDDFKIWLNNTVKKLGGHSACCIRLDDPNFKEAVYKNNKIVSRWIDQGMHGEMEYLKKMLPEKSEPWKTFPGAKAVIVVIFTNSWGDPKAIHPFPKIKNDSLVGYISSYAREIDYHIKGQQILSELSRLIGRKINAITAVDTKPVYERLFATYGGLGIIGPNDLLRVPDRTNVRVFIGSLFVNIDLPSVIHDPKMPFNCNDCMACIKNCPTNAIYPGKPINTLKCISYLTIEKRSILNKSEGRMIEDWIFGCDLCSNVCPSKEKNDSRIPIDLEWLFKSSSGSIKKLIKNNATSYAGVTQLRKNGIIVLKNKKNEKADNLINWVKNNSKSKVILNQISAW